MGETGERERFKGKQCTLLSLQSVVSEQQRGLRDCFLELAQRGVAEQCKAAAATRAVPAQADSRQCLFTQETIDI